MNLLRSIFFVPGDSEKKLAKSRQVPADALVYDLEDSVMTARRITARRLVAAELEHQGESRSIKIVRINALGSPGPEPEEALLDLVGVVRAAPDMIMLPKVRSVADINLLSAYLDVLEVREGVRQRSIRIIAVVTETPEVMFAHGGMLKASKRLAAMTWGAEDLSTALGASANKEADGDWSFTYQMARSQCLMAAKACGVQAIDTLHSDFTDAAGLKKTCLRGRRDGFTGKVAIHPAQVEIINSEFTPSSDEIAFAKKVIAAFDCSPGAGVVQLEGKMLDIPHLKQAQNLLAAADYYQQASAFPD